MKIRTTKALEVIRGAGLWLKFIENEDRFEGWIAYNGPCQPRRDFYRELGRAMGRGRNR